MAQEISFRMLFLTDTWLSAAMKLPLSLATSLSYLLPHILRLVADVVLRRVDGSSTAGA